MTVVPSAEKKMGPDALTSIVFSFPRLVSCARYRPVMIVAPLLNVIAYSLLITGVTSTSKSAQKRPLAGDAGTKSRLGGSADATPTSDSISPTSPMRASARR